MASVGSWVASWWKPVDVTSMATHTTSKPSTIAALVVLYEYTHRNKSFCAYFSKVQSQDGEMKARYDRFTTRTLYTTISS